MTFDLLLFAQFQKLLLYINSLTSYLLSKKHDVRIDRYIIKLKILIIQTQFVYNVAAGSLQFAKLTLDSMVLDNLSLIHSFLFWSVFFFVDFYKMSEVSLKTREKSEFKYFVENMTTNLTLCKHFP